MRNRLSKTIIKVFLLMLFLVPVWAETAGELFDSNVVHDIHLQLDPKDWEQLRSHFRENTYYPASFEWRDQKIENVRIRSRGSASRSPQKPALTIRFSPRFQGLRSLVLRNLIFDFSMMKERLVMEVFRAAGFAAPREVHARLFVNDQYMGLYAMVEPVADKAFVRSHFGEDGGTAFSYKLSSSYRLEWKGRDPAKYVPDPFRPHINENPDPMGVVSLIDVINNSTDEEFVSALGRHLDLDTFLKYIAIETIMDDWDGVMGEYGINNFYLYQHQDSTRFTFIPWDTKWSFFDWADPIHKNWELSPLTRRIFTRPELWATYLSYLEEVARNWVNPQWLLPRINFIYNQIREAVYEEANISRSLVNVSEFEEEVAGVRRFAERRGSNVLQQISDARAEDPEHYKLYFPLFVLGQNNVFGAGYATGLAVVNRTPGVASVRYKAYDMEGRLIGGPTEQILKPTQQLARFERELFGLDASDPQIGWVEVSSNVDVKGFFLTADPGLANFINGADVSSQVGRDLLFMRAEVTPSRGVNTYYVICNPNDSATRVRATFYGFSEPPQDFVIPAKGLRIIHLNPSTHVRQGYMRLSTDQPVTGIQLVGNTQSLTVLRPMTVSSGALDLIFPHFAVNGGFSTEISVINPMPGSANLTITALDVKGKTIGRKSQTLDPGQHLTDSVSGMFGMKSGRNIIVGYVRVQSDIPGLSGFTWFDYGDGRAVAAVPLATAPSTTLTFSHVAYMVPSGSGFMYNTGVALVNPNNFAVSYILRLYNWEGRLIAENRRNLGPLHKEALQLNEFIRDPLPSIAGGYIVVRCETSLYGYELFYTESLDQLAAVPAQ